MQEQFKPNYDDLEPRGAGAFPSRLRSLSLSLKFAQHIFQLTQRPPFWTTLCRGTGIQGRDCYSSDGLCGSHVFDRLGIHFGLLRHSTVRPSFSSRPDSESRNIR